MMNYKSLFLLCSILAVSGISSAHDHKNLQQISDLSQSIKMTADGQKPILIEFAASDCGYCERLEAEQLQPMLKDQDSLDRVVIRKHIIDKADYIKDFNGKLVSNEDFADRYDIQVTPTVILVDHQGKLLGRKLYGYNNADFYSSYLEDAIAIAAKKIQTR